MGNRMLRLLIFFVSENYFVMYTLMWLWFKTNNYFHISIIPFSLRFLLISSLIQIDCYFENNFTTKVSIIDGGITYIRCAFSHLAKTIFYTREWASTMSLRTKLFCRFPVPISQLIIFWVGGTLPYCPDAPAPDLLSCLRVDLHS